MMHIEFKLPTGAGGMAAGYKSMDLRKKVTAWADKHNVTVKNHTQGYRICFIFERDSDYTLFALSWQAKTSWDQFTLVE